MPTKRNPAVDDWQARDDARLLREAVAIQQDKERLQRALIAEAAQASQSVEVLRTFGVKAGNAKAKAVISAATRAPSNFADKIATVRGAK